MYSWLLKKSFVSYILFPISLVFGFVADRRRKKSSPWKPKNVKIIGVGNIVCGGSGKTPFDISLAKFLQSKGYKIAISVRGYKSELENTITLISDRRKLLSQSFSAGDEPKLLAKRLPSIPVIVGKDRLLAVKSLLQIYSDLDFIILEDSFQNFKVAHDFDFVLFKSKVGLGNGWCLPAGYLRENSPALEDADCIVLDGDNEQVESLATRYGKQLRKGKIEARGFFDVEGQEVAVERLKNSVCCSLSAIADPNSFERSVENFGIELERNFRFPDHNNLKKLPWKYLKNADYIIVTDKDLMKLEDCEELKRKLVSLRIEYKFDFEAVQGLV